MIEPEEIIDWKLTTWEGTRQEQYRRWSELPLEKIILALEEMEKLSNQFHGETAGKGTPST